MSDLNVAEKLLVRSGKKYTVMAQLWHPSYELLSGDIKEDSSHLSAEEMKVQDLIIEFVETLPAVERLNYKDVGNWNHFISGIPDFRSQLGHKVRRQAALSIFGAETAQLLVNDETRANNENLKRLVGWDQMKNTYMTQFPVLYGEGEGPRCNRVFRSEWLMRTLRVILFGPSSLNEGNGTSTHDTYGKMWELKSVTPGAMATAATVVHWALSADKELCEMGGTTRIRYDDFFNSAKTVAAALHTYPEGRKTLQQWNEFVFHGQSITDILIPFTEAVDDDLVTLLAEINAAAVHAAELDTPPSDSIPPSDSTPPSFSDHSSS